MATKKHINLSRLSSEARQAKQFLRAIDHKLRLEILEILDENGKTTVTDLWIKLRIEQSVASQHLAIMRRAGIVRTDREGKFIHYSIDYEYLQIMAEKIGQICEEMPEGRVPVLAKAA